MDALVSVIAIAFFLFLVYLALGGAAASSSEKLPESEAFSPPEQGDERPFVPAPRSSQPRDIDLYEIALTASGRFDASHHAFSTSRFPYKPARMVTGLTFEADRLFVLRGEGVATFPFGPSVTVAVVKGRAEGFQELTPFSMTLSSEIQEVSVRFPLEFPGWLEVIHRARKSGAVVEMDEALPARLKEFIAEPLYGDVDLPPIIVRHAETESSVPRPAKCPACGAGVGRKDSCDYCGARLP